jgi:hypothetical protein
MPVKGYCYHSLNNRVCLPGESPIDCGIFHYSEFFAGGGKSDCLLMGRNDGWGRLWKQRSSYPNRWWRKAYSTSSWRC